MNEAQDGPKELGKQINGKFYNISSADENK
jgi:hypothetical protein